ncbi:MAG: tetratricopeptide repeat protein [Gammaproteobacteria bacterium]|nr:tetratricopeptide repeat protein [Gammaproteobacteria bacterium]
MKFFNTKYFGYILFLIALFSTASQAQEITIEESIQLLNTQLQNKPDNISLLMKRADLLFDSNQHQEAVTDYDHIIKIKADHYPAYFGRGMALGRLGDIKKGIDDITVFIKHNQQSSLAYTKRGVRYLWLGDSNKARLDFEKAIQLKPDNAEAHDDLGVIMAQQNKPKEAIEHFNKTIKYDPTYQKAYHNLALTYYIYDNNQAALKIINKALILSPNSKNSILLKSEILKSLGKLELAERLHDDAIFLPDGNWSESAPLTQ